MTSAPADLTVHLEPPPGWVQILQEPDADGTVLRLRPKLMTITTMAAGLLPLLWADGGGAEIMKRIAAPMLGGLVTSHSGWKI